ncbi:MAG: hypothetical protein JKX69_02325 [Rhodobacteraceae bacterium]|nr:hypothetical protein [Paracoccaceae bacterium]
MNQQNRLEERARMAVLGDIGGVRPEKDNRAKSWWDGDFLGAEREDLPVCVRSSRLMHPVLQIRVDE